MLRGAVSSFSDKGIVLQICLSHGPAPKLKSVFSTLSSRFSVHLEELVSSLPSPLSLNTLKSL